MKDMVKKAVKTGFGLGLLSLAEAKKIVGTVKKDMKLSEEESIKLAKEFVASSERASKDVLGKAKKHFEMALTKTGLASKKEIDRVTKMVKDRVCHYCGKKESASRSKAKKPVKRKKAGPKRK